ncbi:MULTISPECIES: enoyl-CoA hydratase [unclassified Mycobacterium]|uniref:enoyl-CoA hydratase n=1 Tax=unclassified Mycobacterium TaxID=2642494 RepID=UPI0029C75FB4|nr:MULTISPECIES: enoyl-CoA hydratase [unclassified Mycobacterium]
MADGTVDVEVADRVAIITINRPTKRNALNVALLRELTTTVDRVDADDDVDVLILTGADPAFCAGLDLQEVGASGGAVVAGGETDSSSPWPALTKPIIGAINGAAITAGFELALHCDFLVASEQARFADTHLAVGVMPGGGLSALLPRRIGFPRAVELSLTGRFVGATEALELGLVNHVVQHADLLATTRGIARDIAAKDQRAVRALLASFHRIAGADGDESALTIERETARTWLRSFDHTEVENRREAILTHNRRQ